MPQRGGVGEPTVTNSYLNQHPRISSEHRYLSLFTLILLFHFSSRQPTLPKVNPQRLLSQAIAVPHHGTTTDLGFLPFPSPPWRGAQSHMETGYGATGRGSAASMDQAAFGGWPRPTAVLLLNNEDADRVPSLQGGAIAPASLLHQGLLLWTRSTLHLDQL